MSYDAGLNLIFSDAIEKESSNCREERKLGVAIVRGALVR
jgi:small nuclear ribonucleoprotein (snRNP)-like protein